MRFRALNRTSGAVLAPTVQRADSLWARMVGLLGRESLPAEQGLWIEPCPQVHTFFMAFPIDVIFLDSKLEVLDVARRMKPWRLSRWLRNGRSVLELASGRADGVKVGDRLDFVKKKDDGKGF